MNRRNLLAALPVALSGALPIALTAPGIARAQGNFPNRNITLQIAFPPGGGGPQIPQK